MPLSFHLARGQELLAWVQGKQVLPQQTKLQRSGNVRFPLAKQLQLSYFLSAQRVTGTYWHFLINCGADPGTSQEWLGACLLMGHSPDPSTALTSFLVLCNSCTSDWPQGHFLVGRSIVQRGQEHSTRKATSSDSDPAGGLLS